MLRKQRAIDVNDTTRITNKLATFGLLFFIVFFKNQFLCLLVKNSCACLRCLHNVTKSNLKILLVKYAFGRKESNSIILLLDTRASITLTWEDIRYTAINRRYLKVEKLSTE